MRREARFTNEPALRVPYLIGCDVDHDETDERALNVRAAALLGESGIFGEPASGRRRQALRAFEQGILDVRGDRQPRGEQ